MSASLAGPSPEPVSLGIVGAGAIVAQNHLPVLASTPGVRVAWMCDAVAASAEGLARAHGVTAVPVPDDLAQLPSADVVLLAIPYGARWPYYDALASRDVALFVEKPLFREEARHRELCEAWPAHRVAHGFQRRSHAAVALARRVVASAPFGALRSAAVGIGDPGIVTFGRYYGDLALAGGGVLFETGVHGVDALLHLTGARDAQVERVRMASEDGLELHADATLALTLAGGERVPAELVVSRLRETRNAVELEFERARVSFSLFGASPALRVETGDGAAFELAPDAATIAPATSHQVLSAHWSSFLEGLASGTANHTSAHDATLTTRVVEQCYAGAS